jgi:nitrate reductase delta subunit
LFEHVHGESRDRGQAMIDLKAQYEKAGLFLSAAELPDLLPLFLEFLSTLPAQEARDMLGQPAHILAAMAERLRKRGSPYEAVFRALVALAAAKPKEDEVSALLALPDPDASDFVALDAAWEDEQVTFGPGASDGCKDGLIARIRGGLRPAPDMPAAAAHTVPPRQ